MNTPPIVQRILPQLSFLSILVIGFWFGFLILSCSSENRTDSEKELVTLDTAAAKTFADSGLFYLYQAWDWGGAERTFTKALEFNPKLGLAHAHYGWYQNLIGNDQNALAEMRKAVMFEPENPLWHAWEAWILWRLEEYELAFKATQKSLTIDSTFSVGNFLHGSMLADQGKKNEAMKYLEKASKDPRWYYGLGVTHAESGDREKALQIVQQLIDSGEPWNTWGVAEIYATLAEENLALEWLDSAYQKRHPYIPWIQRNQKFAAISNSPRFKEILLTLNLP